MRIASPIPYNAPKLSSKVDECKPLVVGVGRLAKQRYKGVVDCVVRMVAEEGWGLHWSTFQLNLSRS